MAEALSTGEILIETGKSLANIKQLNATIKQLQKTVNKRTKEISNIQAVNAARQKEIAGIKATTKAGRALIASKTAQIAKDKQVAAGLKGANTQAQKQIALLKQQKSAASGAAGGMSGLGKPSLRYALYDVGSNLRRIAVGLAAVAAVPVGFAIKYERDFANVARTTEVTGEKLKQLRKDLIAISQATPVSWEDITNIATLAGQLGIAEDLIAGFTETVAKFAATTDLSVEAAATGFGRLNQLIDGVDGQFDQLGSAILAVGVSSVATESQIVNVATNIASMGNLAGLSAQDIVGLSGAMASLGIRPELARGNITRLFSNINKSIAEGRFALTEYGRLTGRTATEFSDAWRNEPTKVLLDFFEGIQREGRDAERTLRDLGITSVRDIPAFLRLAQSQDEVRRLVELSNKEFIRGQKINEQYGIISETTAEQLKRLAQNFATLGSAIGGKSLGPINAFVMAINEAVVGVTNLLSTDVGGWIAFSLIALALVVAAFFAIVSITALAIAALSATKFAVDSLGLSFTGLTTRMFFTGEAFKKIGITSAIATFGMTKFFNVIKYGTLTLGALGLVLGIVGAIYSKYTQRIERTKKVQSELFGSTKKLNEALDKDKEIFDTTGKGIRTFTVELEDNTDKTDDAFDSAYEFANSQESVAEETDNANKALEQQGQALIVVGQNFSDFVRTQASQSSELISLFENIDLQNAFKDQFEGLDAFPSFVELAVGDPEEARKQLKEIRQAVLNEMMLTSSPRELQEFSDSLAPLFDMIDALEKGTYASNGLVDGLGFVSDGMEDIEDRADLASGKIDILMNSIFGAENAARDATDATRDYFNELNNGGDAADITSDKFQKMIDAIAGNEFRSVSERIGDLNEVLVYLQNNGLGSSLAAKAISAAMAGLAVAAEVAGGSITTVDGKLRRTKRTLEEIIASVSPLIGLLGAATEGFNTVGDTSSSAASKVETLAEKFDKLLSSIFSPVQAAQSAAKSILDLGSSYAELGDDAFYASKEIQDAVKNILKSSSSPEEGVANLNALYSQLASTVGSDTAPSLEFLRSTINAVSQEFGVAQESVAGFANIDLSFFNDGLKDVKEEVRTLLDYASDLESVFSRAFDIRFSSTFAIDDIAAAWFDLGENVESARQEIEDLKASQEDLSADRSLKEYFLSVAEAYGDTLRAGILREELAALNREQQDNADAIAEAQQIAGGDLTTQGPGSRQNRAALLGLVGDYQDYITALAESGASQDELRKATEQARQEFIAQAVELGYQEDVVMQYAAAFDDVRTAIDRVPRNITVDANVNPALQASNELNAKLDKSIQKAKKLNSITGGGGNNSGAGGSDGDGDNGGGDNATTAAQGLAKAQSDYKVAAAAVAAARAGIATASTPRESDQWASRLATAQRQLADAQERIRQANSVGFASGGFTGAGSKYQPAGIVHKGEYVVPKQYVNQSTGMPDANFLSQLQNGMRGYAMGGFVGGGAMPDSMMVELSPYDRKLLENAGNVQLRVDGKVVASATNRSNFNEARRGSN